MVLKWFLALVALAGAVNGQSLSLSASVFSTTQVSTSVSLSRSGNAQVPVTFAATTVFPTSVVFTLTASPSPSASTTPTPTPEPIKLGTKLSPVWGVLGGVLVVSGLPSAFWGHKNRWSSFFLTGFYTLSLTCVTLILKFGVLPAINPPSETVQGMFLLASVVAGIAGGGIAIFWWKGAKYFIGAWGGFAFGLWIQCFNNGGLIHPVGLRWVMFIGCSAVGFILCTIPKLHYHVLVVATACMGATSFMLGIDCFTAAGLKEFYVWNLGFEALFPKFTTSGIRFPVSQAMQIELGLMGAVALMGVAVQLRVLKVLQRKLLEISLEQKRRDEEAELEAADRFGHVMQQQEAWERDHPPLLQSHGRNESGFSNAPLMKYKDDVGTPSDSHTLASADGLGKQRQPSGISDFLAPSPSEDELVRSRQSMDALSRQSTGALPAMDLGFGIENDVPRQFISKDTSHPSAGPKKEMTESEREEVQKKGQLLAEIASIRRSIDALRSESPSECDSRRPSMTSRRTLSIDAINATLPASHLRPPREQNPRARTQSMELSALDQASSISRPSSTPVLDKDWDSYVHDRKLLQPPAGVSAPIAPRLPVSPAVTDALAQRLKRESAMEMGEMGPTSSAPLPDSARSQPPRQGSVGNIPLSPVAILPPRKSIAEPTPHRPSVPRTKTFEELQERHREKLRTLQAPVTAAQQEIHDLEVAKARWERSKALEKQAVTRRQADKAKESHKRRGSNDEALARRSQTMDDTRHSRNLSADKMAGSSSKRLSTMKVEGWMQDAELGVRPDRTANAQSSKRDSRAGRPVDPTVSFPPNARPRPPGPMNTGSYDRRSRGPRDPPN